MRRVMQIIVLATIVLFAVVANATFRQPTQPQPPAATTGFDSAITQNAQRMIEEGRRIFRYDTFGDEAFWGDQLKLHQAIVGQKLGGVGPGLSPKAALSLGLKVDAEALPADLVAQIKAGKVDMNDPASTVALLKANAVVGVTGFLNPDGSAKSIGVQCAICHSTVDDSFAPGIGRRLDGWPNRDLNIGAIVALAPDLTPFTKLLGADAETVRKVLRSWGVGKYDAELVQDGKTMRPDGKSAATLLPAAFGLAGVNLHTYTGWGSVTHWNAYVANTQLHGKGVFFDPRLDDKKRFPVAAKAGHGNMRNSPDLITSKLAALHFYQLAIPAPTPPAGSFDAQAAPRGEAVFTKQAGCARCHVPPLFTEPGWPMHKASEIGIDGWQAERSPDKEFYRTTPLRGLFARMKGGFYHDGRFPTLEAVVNHYDGHFNLKLTAAQKRDLIEYLKSL
jgi:mono/diheme cytochrome c family protein